MHIVGEKVPATDLWARIDSVTLTFKGWDRVAGTKKKRQASTGREGKRTRTLSRSIVDHELLTDFMNESRLDALVSAGLLTSREAYRSDKDRCALFVSSSHGEKKRTFVGYTEAHLSKEF